MDKHTQINSLIAIILVFIISIFGYYILNTPDQRNVGEKISDAVDELPNGVDKAARQLEDRTPGEKLSDVVNDIGDDIKKSTNQQ